MKEVRRLIEKTFYQEIPSWQSSMRCNRINTERIYQGSSYLSSSSSEDIHLGKPEVGPFKCSNRQSSQEKLWKEISLTDKYQDTEDEDDQKVFIEWVLLDSMGHAHSIPSNGRNKSSPNNQENSGMCKIANDETVHPSSLSDRGSWSPLNGTKSFSSPDCDVTWLGSLDIQHSHPRIYRI